MPADARWSHLQARAEQPAIGKTVDNAGFKKTEGQLAKRHAIHHSILFLLRQQGRAEKGWRDTSFYWPVVRAQARTPNAIYAAETID